MVAVFRIAGSLSSAGSPLRFSPVRATWAETPVIPVTTQPASSRHAETRPRQVLRDNPTGVLTGLDCSRYLDCVTIPLSLLLATGALGSDEPARRTWVPCAPAVLDATAQLPIAVRIRCEQSHWSEAWSPPASRLLSSAEHWPPDPARPAIHVARSAAWPGRWECATCPSADRPRCSGRAEDPRGHACRRCPGSRHPSGAAELEIAQSSCAAAAARVLRSTPGSSPSPPRSSTDSTCWAVHRAGSAPC